MAASIALGIQNTPTYMAIDLREVDLRKPLPPLLRSMVPFFDMVSHTQIRCVSVK